MEVPRHCWECVYTHSCQAWHYGSGKCKFAAEILKTQNQGIRTQTPKE